MWNFGCFGQIAIFGIPLVSLDLTDRLRSFVDVVAWLFIVAAFGVGLSCLRGAAERGPAPSEAPHVDPPTPESPERSEIGAAA